VRPGSSAVWFPLAAAVLFGATTPVAKLLVVRSDPLVLAGLLYGGAGIGLLLVSGAGASPKGEAGLSREDVPWLAGAVLAGGVVAPVLLLLGLRSGSAATASVLLSLEGVFTGALAWWAFGETLGPRLVVGMLAIAAGAAVLVWAPGAGLSSSWGAAAVAGACLAWAIDNNLTRQVSAGDPLRIAAAKGLVAGVINLALGVVTGAAWPGPGIVAAAAVVGFLGYGLSLALFVLSLRHLGAVRTVAYFAVAPFVGALLSLSLPGEGLTWYLALGAALAAVGVWLYLTEDHGHEHEHDSGGHRHAHTHDAHHAHDHRDDAAGDRHGHWHEHGPRVHAHPHYPDIHHRHRHDPGGRAP